MTDEMLAAAEKSLPFIVDSPKKAVLLYIRHLERNYKRSYEREVTRFEFQWEFGTLTAILLGVFPAVVAAIEAEFADAPHWLHLIKIVAPLTASVITAAIGSFGVYKKFILRERGRLFFRDLLTQAQIRFAKCKEPEDYSRLHEYLRSEALGEQQRQAAEFFGAKEKGSPRSKKNEGHQGAN